jgi:hypothetical protein
MPIRSTLSLLAFALAFIVNPGYFAGCGPADGDEPEFGEAETLALLERANEMANWELESAGVRYALTLSVSQAAGADDRTSLRSPSAWRTSAFACGTRRFRQSASACSTRSELVVEGELTLRELSPTSRTLADRLSVHGQLWTDGHRLLYATLELGSGDNHFILHSDDASSFEVESIEAPALEEGVSVRFPAPGIEP